MKNKLLLVKWWLQLNTVDLILTVIILTMKLPLALEDCQLLTFVGAVNLFITKIKLEQLFLMGKFITLNH